MDATPFDFGDARPLVGGRYAMGIEPLPLEPSTALARTWAAIHAAAVAVGTMAGVDDARVSYEIEYGLSGDLGDAEGSAIEQDLRDLAEILQRGISALLTAHTRGGVPQPAASALWNEFLAERDAIVERAAREVASGARI